MRTETDERILGEESFSRSRRRFVITRTSSDATDVCCIRRQHRLCTASIVGWKSRVDCVIVMEVGELKYGADSLSDLFGGLHRPCLIAESPWLSTSHPLLSQRSKTSRIAKILLYFFLFFFFFFF